MLNTQIGDFNLLHKKDNKAGFEFNFLDNKYDTKYTYIGEVNENNHDTFINIRDTIAQNLYQLLFNYSIIMLVIFSINLV